MQHRDPEDDELARRLEAYAEARLSPEPSAPSRMRAQVMAAAQRHAALARADGDRAAAPAAHSGRMRRSPWRRSMTALLAAGLTLGLGVSSVAAVQPGGPLYGVRIWAETLTLPTTAAERAQAELRRLEERLTEAAAATAAGDTNAANAALEAYGAIVSEATTGADVSAAARATLDAGVRRNIEVLTVLAGRVPEPARDAIEHAIERSDSALDTIHGQPGGNLPAATPTKSPKPGATDRPEGTANPNKPTPDPAETPKPHPTLNPEATPKADPTPKAGGRPSDPPGQGGGAPETPPGGDQGD
ncbi:MAG: DUF5667 domain-containing protein [Candidatus Limnocylindrales bacterium]|nr:DUF5667 domain-containing protein [Candidatus Limnocylindrales bacterium]